MTSFWFIFKLLGYREVATLHVNGATFLAKFQRLSKILGQGNQWSLPNDQSVSAMWSLAAVNFCTFNFL